MKKVILCLVVMAALFSGLNANPFTLTGELRAPDAYILPNLAAKVQLTSYLRKEESAPDTDFEASVFGMLQVGVLNRIELGLMGGDDIVFGNIKVKLIEETIAYPQVAIGVDNLFSKVATDAVKNPPSGSMADNPDKCYYERNSLYLVASKQMVLRGVLGLPELSAVLSGGFGRNRFVGQVTRSDQFEGFFVSSELSPMPDLYLFGEIDGHNLNLGAKYNWKNFAAKVGYLGAEESWKKDNPNHRFALGISYVYDKHADARRRPDMISSPIQGGAGDATREQIGRSGGASATSANDLFEELKRLRESREQAQKVLEELRKQLQDLEKEAGSQ